MNHQIACYNLKWGKTTEVELRLRTHILMCELDNSQFPGLVLWVLEDPEEEIRVNRVFYIVEEKTPMAHPVYELVFIGKVRLESYCHPDVFLFEWINPREMETP